MLGLVNNKFIIGREEFYPFSAEMHYFRVHKRYWSVCFERIRRAGFRIISSYVPWNLHESELGKFDFIGPSDSRKDILVFLELAREFGFKVILRPGPWIGAEWVNGGLPDFVLRDREAVAKSPTGEDVQAQIAGGVNGGKVPSYLHPVYLAHVKRYFSALVEAIQNYIYPKGPVFLIQIDYYPGGEHGDEVFGADYSPLITGELYPEFLREKYQTIANIGKAYRRKFKNFNELEPPHRLTIRKPEDLLKYFDWIDFKEWSLASYIARLRERLESLGVGSLFSTNIYLDNPVSFKLLREQKVVVGTDLSWPRDLFSLARHLRYLRTNMSFPWASSFLNGKPAEDPKSESRYRPTDLKASKRLLVASLAAGVKGLNHYMFVERDHWYGAPLGNDGEVRASYEMVKEFNLALERMQFENLRSSARVGIASYRPYLRFCHLGPTPPEKPPPGRPELFSYLYDLMETTLPDLCRGLSSMCFDYGVPDCEFLESFDDFSLIFVPTSEFMGSETQEFLIEQAKGGKTIVLVGLLPKLDDKMRSCATLSEKLGVKTRPHPGSAFIQAYGERFPALTFGEITKRGAGSKIVAKEKTHVFGVSKKVGKGEVYLFTFDLAPRLNPQKTIFLNALLAEKKITTPVSCSDPRVQVVVHDGPKMAAVYLFTPEKGENGSDGGDRKVIITLDCKKLGITAKRVRMLDVFGAEKIVTSPKELSEGRLIEIEEGDSRMYLVNKK
jgi:beta-galactosidase